MGNRGDKEMNQNSQDAIQNLYRRLISAWNHRDAREMADLFSEQGVQMGFDGSIAAGREEIFNHLAANLRGSSDTAVSHKSEISPHVGCSCSAFARDCRHDSSGKRRHGTGAHSLADHGSGEDGRSLAN